MSWGITKTVPKQAGWETVESLYDGSLSEYEFHMAGTPKQLTEGDYVYTIFDNHLHGRLKIKELVPGVTNSTSGKPQTLIRVEAPGERLAEPIPRKGHQGTRYYDGAEWPAD